MGCVVASCGRVVGGVVRAARAMRIKVNQGDLRQFKVVALREAKVQGKAESGKRKRELAEAVLGVPIKANQTKSRLGKRFRVEC